MSTSVDHTTPTGEDPVRGNDTRSFWTGRSELFVGVLVIALGGFLLIRSAMMDVPSSVSFLGPRFFPVVVGALLTALGVALTVRMLLPRSAAASAEGDGEDSSAAAGASSDWKPLLLTAAALAAHLALLQTAGWIIAGALLFWGVSCALGSGHKLRDLGISFVVSAAVQLAFSAGLGLPLPSGVLVGVF
ncbi:MULTISPECIES: tripartite tricarboxylate transporter TctB family protein [unclassified Actinopolyspora]|uniref:tripartite tricarboxylate transporter TctB family protein n=1 Tax=unclassified Actinopolyspora TaxID=2639451 RepID=UPI0013F5FD85|nr:MULTISPECIES: tripartite tricarboxylate transporter TctB family protein [unclassified Actinopolyspora]NHD18399.1 tripartite tricarboxylate transporter TctB family protein [Actinopolyspora sp. BKK2]NHE77642.1 tripartite tricarboxylate transporter TctB family protein [Actinopolyspora sp. BKK1]